MSAFGAKRTFMGAGPRPPRTLMTHSGHRPAAFAALHAADLPYLTREPWRWGKPVSRREFLPLIGGAVTWPFAASTQQAERMRRVGVLTAGTDANDPDQQSRIAPFLQAMQQL